MQSPRVVSKQLAKYVIVGALTNSLAYGLYIAITLAGVSPIAGKSAVYVVASLTSFAANRGWTS